MRDDRDFIENFSIKTTNRVRGTGSTSTSYSSSTSQRTRTRRSESAPTKPIAGRFFEPTNYQAIFSFCSSGPGRCQHVRRNAVQPNNPYFDTIVTTEWEGLSVGSAWRYGINATLLTPDVPTSIVSRARNSVLSQIRDSDLDLGVTAGEIRETARGISDLCVDAARLFKALRHPVQSLSGLSVRAVAQGMRSGAIPKAVSREYLRYMYGIKPIMSDIYAVASGLESGFLNAPICVARSRILNPSFGPSSVPGTSSGKVWFTGTAKQGCIVEAQFSLQNPTLYQLWRYGLTNPLSLAWELTTLSFVVDWFTGIGNWLSALQQPLGLKYLHGYETTFTELRLTRHENYYRSRISPTLTYPTEEGIGTSRIRTDCMRRTAGLGFPVPLPYFRVELNLSQVLSLIALLTART